MKTYKLTTHLTNVCSLCILHMSFSAPCSIAWLVVPWCQIFFLRHFLLMLTSKVQILKNSKCSSASLNVYSLAVVGQRDPSAIFFAFSIQICTIGWMGWSVWKVRERKAKVRHPSPHNTPPFSLSFLFSLLRAKSYHQFCPRVMPISII